MKLRTDADPDELCSQNTRLSRAIKAMMSKYSLYLQLPIRDVINISRGKILI
jgi:hypothetical protein